MSDNIQERIRRLAAQHFNDIVDIRRRIHHNPELSFGEFETSALVQEQLRETGIPFRAGYVKTGVAGWIDGKDPEGHTVALRADMDALPVVELNDIPFRSKNEGKMHACGHDLHVAALLGASRILHALRDEFDGRVLLVFQPAEEKLPGGANLMLAEGVFSEKLPDVIIGQHVMPRLDAGKVGYRPGVCMASSDEIYITVKGTGGHGAIPHQLVDPVLIAAHIITGLQQIVSRNADPAIPSVLSFGKVDAPGATNVIPAEVRIEGTFRTMNERWREEARQRITRMATSIAESMGGSCEVKIIHGYPVLSNHETFTRKAARLSGEFLGQENVVDLDLRMTAEDFAYFAEKIPGVFYRFGTTDKAGKFISPLHSATYMADETSLVTAMGNLAYLAISFLRDFAS